MSAFAQIPEKPMITTTGKAIVYAEPDEVIINIRIYNEAKSLEEAKQASDKVAKAIIGYCRQMKIEDKHVQTDYLSITTNYRRHNQSNQQIIFTASQNISVCLKDLSLYEDVMEGFIARGVYGVSSSQFRTTEMRKYKDMARVKAIKAAKEKAVLLATELQRKVGAAHYISEVTPHRNQPMTRMAYANTMGEMAGDGGGDDTIAPGQLVISTEVEVTFMLE
ncbi:MAG: SIMPL domain-containing protein [Bacteroidia bacterium]|nr:SIMPL domain-containing protein [Bacteroidia bacterium]